jgi:hypothetical protein
MMDSQFVLSHLEKTARRIANQDRTLTHLQLPVPSECVNRSGGTATFWIPTLLEEEVNQDALDDCLRELKDVAAENQHIETVTLVGLPEPDLQNAFKAIRCLPDLKSLQVLHIPRGQCPRVQTVTAMLQKLGGGLQHLHIETAIQVPSQAAADLLAAALKLHSATLRHVHLHLVPRCRNIQRPNIHMDVLLQALACEKLQTCELVLGYENNPYGQPMVSTSVLNQFLTSSTALERLQLDNFGLNNDNLSTLAQHVKRCSSLRHLLLRKNPNVTAACMEQLCQAIEENNFSLQTCQLWSNPGKHVVEASLYNKRLSPRAAAIVRQQKQLDCLCTLNKLGRGELLKDASNNEAWVEAIATAEQVNADTSLDAVYTLLRSNPTLVKSAASKAGSTPVSSEKGGEGLETETVLDILPLTKFLPRPPMKQSLSMSCHGGLSFHTLYYRRRSRAVPIGVRLVPRSISFT